MGLFSFLNFSSGCDAAAMNKDVTKFKWYGVATAPREYPMEVNRGDFYYKGERIMPLPSGGTLTTGWGESASVYVRGDAPIPLPDRLQVEFFSYAEKQSYKADIALPYQDILAKFQQQLRENPDRPYGEILLGIAPGGAMSVWIKGPQTTEIFFGQAEKVVQTPREAFELPFKSKEQSDAYIESALAGRVTPEQLTHIKTHGAPVGAWARFRKLYKWVPVYKEGKPVLTPKMPVTFLNGESYSLPTQFNDELASTPKPLPGYLHFKAQATIDEQPIYRIDFEPFELMEAFEKLGAHGEKVFIEFDAQVPRQNLKIRIYNDVKPKDDKTPKEFIELKKFYVKP